LYSKKNSSKHNKNVARKLALYSQPIFSLFGGKQLMKTT